MDKRVLLVGITYNGPKIDGVFIETKGLCRFDVLPQKSADALYEYDVIVINPASYSHLIFGEETSHSSSFSELGDLKKENDLYDLDGIFDLFERRKEMDAALKYGAIIIWVAAKDKYVNFFGYRSLYNGYLSNTATELLKKCNIHLKNSCKVSISKTSSFSAYFDTLSKTSWNLCWDTEFKEYISLANTPEYYSLGAEIVVNEKRVWILSPPTSDEGVTSLVECALKQERIYEPSNFETEKINRFSLTYKLNSRIDNKSILIPKSSGEGKAIKLTKVRKNKDDISIFLSYSHIDEYYRDKLESHFVMLKRNGIITTWHDRKIIPGQDLNEEINKNLLSADIIILIVSVDFLNSEYCFEKEMTKALEMNSLKRTRVIPVIARPCDWLDSPFKDLKALPSDGISISRWVDKDEAFLQVVIGIKQVIRDIKATRI